MEPSVREASTRTEYFDFDAHRIWWDRRFGDRNTRMWIAAADELAGAVRYGRVETHDYGHCRCCFPACNQAEISIAVRPEYRGQGVANQLLTETMPLVLEALGVDKLVALVKVGNEASVGLFLGVGFKLKGEEFRMGKHHWRYEL